MKRRWTWQIGKIGGISIHLHASWILMLLLLSSWLSMDHLPALFDGLSLPMRLTVGVGLSIAVLVSVFVHELAHLAMARHRAIDIVESVLFPFGGVAQTRRRPLAPADSLYYALAGPGASLVLGLFFLLCAALLSGSAGLWQWLAGANLLIAAGNLIPVFPLDGGRIMKSAIWRSTGNLGRALQISRGGGWVLAFALGVEGVFLLLWYNDLLAAIGFVLLGWLIQSATDFIPGESWMMLRLRGTSVARVMTAFESPLGEWSELSTLDAEDHLLDALEKMDAVEQERLVVLKAEQPVGTIDRRTILRYLQSHAPEAVTG